MGKTKRPYTRKPKASAPPDDEKYSVSLKLDNTILEGSGETVLDALRALPKPDKITTKSIITVSKGDKRHSRPLTVPLANRLFFPAAQIYHAKNYELLLK